MLKIERLTVSASYTAIKDGLEIAGRVEFVARVSDSTKGFNLEDRARKAVARRLKVPASNCRRRHQQVDQPGSDMDSNELDALQQADLQHKASGHTHRVTVQIHGQAATATIHHWVVNPTDAEVDSLLVREYGYAVPARQVVVL